MKIIIETPEGMEPEEALEIARRVGFGTNITEEGCYIADSTQDGEVLPFHVTVFYEKRKASIQLTPYQQIKLY